MLSHRGRPTVQIGFHASKLPPDQGLKRKCSRRCVFRAKRNPVVACFGADRRFVGANGRGMRHRQPWATYHRPGARFIGENGGRFAIDNRGARVGNSCQRQRAIVVPRSGYAVSLWCAVGARRRGRSWPAAWAKTPPQRPPQFSSLNSPGRKANLGPSEASTDSPRVYVRRIFWPDHARCWVRPRGDCLG